MNIQMKENHHTWHNIYEGKDQKDATFLREQWKWFFLAKYLIWIFKWILFYTKYSVSEISSMDINGKKCCP